MIKIKNLNSFNNKLNKKLKEEGMKNVKRAVFRGANVVRTEAVESIARGPKTGKIYTRGSIAHQASAPGEAPATDTGFLQTQITTQVKVQDDKVIGQIIASAPYARHLEFGTTNIMPRPFMQPALEKNKNKILRIFKKEGVVD